MLVAVAFICPTKRSIALYLAVNVLVMFATRKSSANCWFVRFLLRLCRLVLR
ncbi:hypothetical protein D3C71_2186580 [compost metagenome]